MSTNDSPEAGNRQLPKLKPPPRNNPAGIAEPPRTAAFAALAGMVALLIVAGAVLFLLPQFFGSSMEQSAAPGHPRMSGITEAPLTTVTTAENQTKPDGSPGEATRQLEIFLALKARSKSENVSIWAQSAYQDILDLEILGDRFFTDKEYLKAENAYSRAAGDLKNLLDGSTAVFREQLENGYRFLAEEQGQAALDSFNKALAINPESEEARAAAQRAENLDTVLALYKSALAHEQSGALSAAEETLTKLQQLAPNYTPAEVLLNRVRKTIEKQQFEEQMSAFFTDLQKEDFVQARKALKILKALDAASPQVASAEEILVAKEQAALVDHLRRHSEALSAKEQWQEALAIYRQALTIAPDALFAVNGLEQAKKRVELDQAMEDNLSQPHRLQEKAQLEAAQQLLGYARQFVPAGDRLSSQIDRLDTLVTFASTPVTVILNSDNKTSIAIYHVGKMGTFFSTQISLKPGKYTVVGSRNGFHDVREIFVVDPRKSDNQLFIACREPI